MGGGALRQLTVQAAETNLAILEHSYGSVVIHTAFNDADDDHANDAMGFDLVLQHYQMGI